MPSVTKKIAGYFAGTWTIDPAHSTVAFTVRHLGVSKVHGRFDVFEGVIVTAEDILGSTVTVTIQASSVNTNNEQRDRHIRSTDFLDVANLPTLSFTSTSIRTDNDEFLIDGELTLHGVTKQVTLTTEIGGFGDGLTTGTKVIGVSATTEISRTAFDVGPSIPSAVVSDKVRVELEVEAVLQLQ
ncbi:YceI family protein [Amycolatopsis sp. NPDC098790]|uniref:YceI family protein n=1 Tax=Amycolatopsis sp. NPDC098790 TaxID=3363939 RepID=UPI00381017E7